MNPPPRRAGDFVVTVLVESTQAIDGPARPGHRVREEVWSEKVRTCVRPSSRMPHVVGWSDWRAVGIRGHRYPADPRAARPPRGPAYPLHRTLSPGECATGYWSVVVPERAVRAIQLAPGGGPALIEWLTLR